MLSAYDISDLWLLMWENSLLSFVYINVALALLMTTLGLDLEREIWGERN